ncbi:putative inositol-phosphate phosphatase [Corynebacterium glutamicum MB001]|uniref:Archaeal fructose-1,6-bisphosphatase and related enzymes of inositol monophosphatase family n=2 Tax=Corynebacterium TaxID=1716 RepID=Q8NNT8_CORGL|nr:MULTISPECIES: inositol monophosphatase [Corynebacterium]AGT05830.1 putative inositol-phosphate phosphatase [Corynebacterium glutamicum MB001]AJE67776.1 fructose 1,6-bisphosphatase [Corynebacterium glutamicum]AKF27884.1 fructose 1,6-bisphosphatase [[Brevibacterium] flavum]ALP50542.1 fructose 1,6-bisphosphatase [Corynebacterium glutamicum]AMA00560.1 fructose 1,6-bisphosphatase [Corynebacterium glutamicum]
MDARGMLAIAEAVVDDAEALFMQGFGAAPAHMKSPGDFATEVDMAIESHMRSMLNMMTGIAVIGEEGGGATSGTRWVIDPIDGTANFAASNPMSAILVSLLVDDQPVLGITSMPMLGKRLTAFEGSPLMINGEPQEPLQEQSSLVSHIGFSSMASPRNTAFPVELRRDLLTELTESYLRPRITGSVGVDLAFTAQGIFGACVSFSPHVWDNSAGVMLMRAAGAQVTDTEGHPWAPGRGVVAGTKRAHDVLLSKIEKVRLMHADAGNDQSLNEEYK